MALAYGSFQVLKCSACVAILTHKVKEENTARAFLLMHRA